MNKENKSYEEAMEELETFVAKIEDSEGSLKEMTDDIQKTVELIKYCREELRKNEENIHNIITFVE